MSGTKYTVPYDKSFKQMPTKFSVPSVGAEMVIGKDGDNEWVFFNKDGSSIKVSIMTDIVWLRLLVKPENHKTLPPGLIAKLSERLVELRAY